MPKLSFLLCLGWKWNSRKKEERVQEMARPVEAEAGIVAGEGVENEVVEGANVEVVALPEPAAILAMTYAPGFYLAKDKYRSRIPNAPRYLSVHGLYHSKSLSKPPSDFPTQQEVMNYKFRADVLDRIFNRIPKIGDIDSDELMRIEMNKHGKHIAFLRTPDAFATFALNCYERYNFHGLLDFVAETVANEHIGEECTYLGFTWVGVRIVDFLRIANSFERIRDAHGEVTLQVLSKDGRYFLFEISMFVTQDEMPASRTIKQPEVFINKRKPESRNLSYERRVYMLKQ